MRRCYAVITTFAFIVRILIVFLFLKVDRGCCPPFSDQMSLVCPPCIRRGMKEPLPLVLASTRDDRNAAAVAGR